MSAIRDSDGYTALDRARQNNQTLIIDVLQAWPAAIPDRPAP